MTSQGAMLLSFGAVRGEGVGEGGGGGSGVNVGDRVGGFCTRERQRFGRMGGESDGLGYVRLPRNLMRGL